ncbi:unnamed protein product, partial [Prorocentrum cordatum]
GASPNAPAAWSARGAPAVRRAAGAECGRWRATATGARRCAARPRGCAPGVAGSALGLVAGCRLLAAAACSEDGSASQEREAESRPSAGTVGRNKERRYRDKGSESVTKNPYRSLLVLRRCVLKQHCLARERHPERSLPAPMEHCHFASGARQLWRGAPTRNETRIERGRRRRRVMKRRSSKRRDRRRQAHTFGRRKRRVSRETTWRPCAAAYAGRPSGTLHWKRGHLSEPLRGEDDPDFFRGSLTAATRRSTSY